MFDDGRYCHGGGHTTIPNGFDNIGAISIGY